MDQGGGQWDMELKAAGERGRKPSGRVGLAREACRGGSKYINKVCHVMLLCSPLSVMYDDNA